MGSREIEQNFFIPEFWAKAFQGVLDFWRQYSMTYLLYIF